MSAEVHLIMRCQMSHNNEIIILDHNYKTLPYDFNMSLLRDKLLIMKITGREVCFLVWQKGFTRKTGQCWN